MKIAIIEDELLAAQKLERYLKKWNSDVEIVTHQTSIIDAVNWFKHNENNYDVIFLDIQLSDGLSFEIFKQVTIKKPIIFCTAFDEYAIDAFNLNSISYILKPITFTDISNAMRKLNNMKSILTNTIEIENIEHIYKKRKERFLVKMGNHIRTVKTEDISTFFAEGRTVYLVSNTDKKYIVDFTLEELNSLLDPNYFFRVNRSFIINLNAVKDVIVYSNSRLKVLISESIEKDIIVSRDKVSNFKNWLEGID